MGTKAELPNLYIVSLMEKYDSCSPEERSIMMYSIYGDLGSDREDAYQEAADMDFGPDHPQAQGEFCCPLKP